MSPHCDDENRQAGHQLPPSHNIHASTQWRQTSAEGWMPAGSDKGREVLFTRTFSRVERPLWVETGHRSWPLIANYAVICGRVRIRETGGATGTFSASLRVRKMRNLAPHTRA
jgi:hypothetical protein